MSSTDTAPNACATCPRTGCTLFDGACGRCAFGTNARREGDSWGSYLVESELAALRGEVARLTAELGKVQSAQLQYA